MEEDFRIVGFRGDIPFDEPANKPLWPPLDFLEFVKDENGCISGATFLIHFGKEYGFGNGTKKSPLNAMKNLHLIMNLLTHQTRNGILTVAVS